MYDELVKRLRGRANLVREYNESGKLFDEAADAIEELSRENESLANSVNEASDILRRRWIPVTERLPGIHIWALVYSEKTGIGFDFVNSDGMWHTKSDVTHWMPLPEPPKEKT